MTLDPKIASWYTPPARTTIADYDRAIDRATDALWRQLPGDVQDGYDRDTVRRWATAVVDAAAGPAAGNYGPGQPRPRPLPDGHTITRGSAGTVTVNTDNACPDRYASPHGAGTRPGGCATCATQCPHCTSDRREWPFVMPVMDRSGEGLAGVAACTDPWPTPTTTTEPT